MMIIRSLLAVIVVSGLTIAGCLAAPHLARAQDGMTEDGMAEDDDDYSFEDFMGEIEKDKADQERCGGSGEISRAEQQAACTRLIEDAPNENDLVGTYYVNRATTHEDAAGPCKDVSKGIEIIEREKSNIYGKGFLAAARNLEEAACR